MATPRKKSRPVQFNVRVASELRDSLKRSAKKNGVSLNVEAVRWLGRHLAEEAMLGGEEARERLQFITNTFVLAGSSAAGGRKLSSWIGEPTAYSAGMFALIESLMLGQPGATLEKCRLQIESLKGRVATHFVNTGKTS